MQGTRAMLVRRAPSSHSWAFMHAARVDHRHFAASRGEFLPFLEARELARSLKLKGVADWKKFTVHTRPPGLPSDPSRFYRGDFVTWYDWLGHEDARRVDRRATSLKVTVDPRRALTNEAKDNLIRSLGSGFEFVEPPRHSPLGLLFRPRGSDGDWCGIYFRCKRRLRPETDKSVTFSALGNCRGAPLVCFDVDHDRFLVFEPGQLSVSFIQLPLGRFSSWEEFLVSRNELAQKLHQFYGTTELRPISEWISFGTSGTARNPLDTCKALQSILFTRLFEPAGVAAQPTVSTVGTHNLKLDGRRVLQRASTQRYASRSAWLADIFKRVGGTKTPLHAVDDLHFLLCSVNAGGAFSDSVRGCFLFPKHVLAERGVIASENKFGLILATLYPPNSKSEGYRDARAERARQWQNPFYVDLSGDEESLQENRDKFRRILHSVPVD